MGKFSGVLIASDYDNTIAYTQPSLINGTPPPPVSEENRAAISYFISEGGTFSVATGRALSSFDTVRGGIPCNGPTILFNGAAIYDYAAHTYLCTAFLPPRAADCAQQVLDRFPALALEVYHDGNTVHTVHANALSRRRLRLTRAAVDEAASVPEVPQPFSKMVFPSENAAALDEAESFIAAQSWSKDFSVMRSAELLLEFTAFGADKGSMVDRLSALVHIAPENLYCVGDQANDISMLRRARIPFAPANAIDAVKALPGIHILPDCTENAIAAMIAELDKLY
ncbi:MAG: HAD-IIB family hydrolase [Oscillospiraceae bacterium]|nr:HAD-IIB family hydrolase [Oscillospiraceae bacterium]